MVWAMWWVFIRVSWDGQSYGNFAKRRNRGINGKDL